MLITTSATVMSGKCSFGMLSLSGNIWRASGAGRPGRAYPRAAGRRPARSARGLGPGRRHRTPAGAALGDVLIGVVGGAHERAGRDVIEAELVGVALERGELLRVPVAHDGQVARR